MQEAGKLREVGDPAALACAVFLSVSGAGLKKARGAIRALEADPAAVAAVLGAVREARALSEAAAADASAEGGEGAGENARESSQNGARDDARNTQDGEQSGARGAEDDPAKGGKEDGDETH